jgi:transposase InsO family protein
MSRQNYYTRRQLRQRRQVDAQLISQLVQQERRLQPRLGARKLRVLLAGALAEAKVCIGRDRFFEVLRQRDLLLKPRRSEHPRTTNSYHLLPVFRNLIKDRPVSRPNQVWVGDLTYLRTEEGFMFLALLTDKMSRKIVGYHCGDSLESMGCQRALEMALAQLGPGEQPIAGREVRVHHLDGGKLLQHGPRGQPAGQFAQLPAQGHRQAVGQKRHEDMRLHSALFLVKDRAQRQIIFQELEGSFDLHQLEIIFPQQLGISLRQVGAQ